MKKLLLLFLSCMAPTVIFSMEDKYREGRELIERMEQETDSLKKIALYAEALEAQFSNKRQLLFDDSNGDAEKFYSTFLATLPDLAQGDPLSDLTMLQRHSLALEIHTFRERITGHPELVVQFELARDNLLRVGKHHKPWLSTPGDEEKYQQLVLMRNMRRRFMGVEDSVADDYVGDTVLGMISRAQFLCGITRSLKLTPEERAELIEKSKQKPEERPKPSAEMVKRFKEVVGALERAVGRSPSNADLSSLAAYQSGGEEESEELSSDYDSDTDLDEVELYPEFAPQVDPVLLARSSSDNSFSSNVASEDDEYASDEDDPYSTARIADEGAALLRKKEEDERNIKMMEDIIERGRAVMQSAQNEASDVVKLRGAFKRLVRGRADLKSTVMALIGETYQELSAKMRSTEMGVERALKNKTVFEQRLAATQAKRQELGDVLAQKEQERQSELEKRRQLQATLAARATSIQDQIDQLRLDHVRILEAKKREERRERNVLKALDRVEVARQHSGLKLLTNGKK